MKKSSFAYINTPSGLTLFLNGKPHQVANTSVFYGQILDLFDEYAGSPETLEEEIQNLFDRQDIKDAGFENDSYNGVAMHPALVEKLQSIKDSGMPVDGLIEFFERLSNNPSETAVNELYDFLSYKELPITKDGYFLAYKGVTEDYWSISGNTKTKMEDSVKVDRSGRCYNGVGEKVRVKFRNQVDDNRENHCSRGLHAGSLSYATGFGNRVVVVKIDPADVVSVPSDCQCQKLRCVGYEVVSDFEQEIVAPVVEADSQGVKDNTTDSEWDNFVDRVEKYVMSKCKQGLDRLAIQSIQNSFSPEYPSKNKVMSALQDLGHCFDNQYVIFSY